MKCHLYNQNLNFFQAYVLQERGSLLELVDPNLGSEYSSEEAMVMLNVALLCTNASPTLRPTMSQVVSMLEGETDIQDILLDPGYSAASSKFKSIRNHFWQNPSGTNSIISMRSLYTDSGSSCVETEESYHLVNANSDRSNKWIEFNNAFPYSLVSDVHYSIYLTNVQACGWIYCNQNEKDCSNMFA